MAALPIRTLVHPSPVARRLLLHLFSIARTSFPVPWRIDPFEKPGVGVTWVRSGRGQLQLDDTVWQLAPGSGFWLYSTERVRVFTPAAGDVLVAEAFWFGGPGVEGWLEELDAIRRPAIRLAQPVRVTRAYAAMRELVRRRPAHWEWRVHQHLSNVLGEFLIARRRLVDDGNTPPEPIARVLNALEADRGRDWKTTELAAVAGMSYSSFGALFRETLHQAPHAYLQRLRLDRAREMLADPKLRIKEIAQRLHFSSVHYFSSFFHKHERVTPTDFRKHLGLAEET